MCIVFPKPIWSSLPCLRSRSSGAVKLWDRAGLLCITKEPWASASRRPAPPPPRFPAAARARVPSRNWLPGPRFPGTRKEEGVEAATIGRVWAKRATRSAKTPRGGEPGPCCRAIGRGHPSQPPLIGGFSNSVSRRQRRCFSGDCNPGRSRVRRVGAQALPGRHGVPASVVPSERVSAPLTLPSRCLRQAADHCTGVPQPCGAVGVSGEAKSLLRKAGVSKRVASALVGRRELGGKRGFLLCCQPFPSRLWGSRVFVCGTRQGLCGLQLSLLPGCTGELPLPKISVFSLDEFILGVCLGDLGASCAQS